MRRVWLVDPRGEPTNENEAWAQITVIVSGSEHTRADRRSLHGFTSSTPSSSIVYVNLKLTIQQLSLQGPRGQTSIPIRASAATFSTYASPEPWDT